MHTKQYTALLISPNVTNQSRNQVPCSLPTSATNFVISPYLKWRVVSWGLEWDDDYRGWTTLMLICIHSFFPCHICNFLKAFRQNEDVLLLLGWTRNLNTTWLVGAKATQIAESHTLRHQWNATREWGKFIMKLLAWYYHSPWTEEDEMWLACTTRGRMRNANKILVGKPQGKGPFWRPRNRREGNIKMHLRKLDWARNSAWSGRDLVAGFCENGNER
jgi:hypothetical protein